MNLCSFSGFLTDNPKVSKMDSGVSRAEFTLVTYTYRKTKSTGVGYLHSSSVKLGIRVLRRLKSLLAKALKYMYMHRQRMLAKTIRM